MAPKAKKWALGELEPVPKFFGKFWNWFLFFKNGPKNFLGKKGWLTRKKVPDPVRPFKNGFFWLFIQVWGFFRDFFCFWKIGKNGPQREKVGLRGIGTRPQIFRKILEFVFIFQKCAQKFFCEKCVGKPEKVSGPRSAHQKTVLLAF
ncbi:hypothetical protein, unlikely [Trypanosoma congolense IL3000]|uniref:Uncharacterized protein n=1 Tax=Trypanosoma congolense (strain IL3000) TaxID=1068625 RepID=F9W950_TRYCI|nr:hypothetical protein, unlikely [Trypanosoma congolense IL3000]